MAALNATALSALGITKVVVDWLPYGNELIHLYRVLPDGQEQEVVGSPVTLSGGKAVLYDTTAPTDIPLHYRATMVQATVLRDPFTRVVVDAWGTPEFSATAGTWNLAVGPAVDFDVNGTTATMTHPTVNVSHRANAPGVQRDTRIEATVSVSAVATGTGALRAGMATRWLNDSNFYSFGVDFGVGGSIYAFIGKAVGGVNTTLASTTRAISYTAGQPFRLAAESIGDRHRLWVWTVGDQISAIPLLEAVDSSAALQVPGNASLSSSRRIGNTNTSAVIRFDNALVIDREAREISTVSPVTILASPHGWMRDPLAPARSVRLDNCALHTEDCLNPGQFVFFRGFGGETYDSSSGVFEVLDAERPITIAQRRKGVKTDLKFASATLADVQRIRALFSSGRPLVLSLPVEYGWGIDTYGTDMFTGDVLSAGRLNPRDMRKPYREWAIPIAAADDDITIPSGTGSNDIPVPGATYQDMQDTGLTYAQLQAANRTYLQWSQGVWF